MEIAIDVTIPVPRYKQIADQLRAAIASGEITSRLPSLWEIVEETGVSFGVAKKAVDILKDEGLVVAHRGLGTFVKKAEQ